MTGKPYDPTFKLIYFQGLPTRYDAFVTLKSADKKTNNITVDCFAGLADRLLLVKLANVDPNQVDASEL